MKSNAAVNKTYENYEMLVQMETLQDDWNKKCSRLNPMLHKSKLGGEKKCALLHLMVERELRFNTNNSK